MKQSPETESTVRDLVADGWHPDTLQVWLRSKCHCSYCDKDMLSDADVFFYDSTIDHLIPLSRNGADEIGNRLLACRACNMLKRDFDPREPFPVDHVAMIARAREFIETKRRRNDGRLHQIHRPGLLRLQLLERRETLP